MNPPTLKDLIDFVIANKSNKVFRGDSDNTIANKLYAGVHHQSLFFHTDSNGKIVGMILADRDDEKKLLFITENLAMSLATLKIFARKAKERWPDYKLEWHKHDIHKKHNTHKLYKKLSV
jgi:hypothetical protein